MSSPTFDQWFDEKEAVLSEFAATQPVESPDGQADFDQVVAQLTPILRKMQRTQIDPVMQRMVSQMIGRLQASDYGVNQLPAVLAAVVNGMMGLRSRTFAGGAQAVNRLKHTGPAQ